MGWSKIAFHFTGRREGRSIERPFHITRERIREIEAKALRKLRHP
ncbi:MAG: sigma factor-like helix-turn-helix DNA-binding protein, partial [Anaerolineales bacterium]